MNIAELISNPLDEIDAFYFKKLTQNQISDYNLDMSSEFNSILFKNEILSQIPNFMNFSSYLDLQKHNGKLVKLTYMIQNIEDPEIYANFLVQTQNPSQIINLKYREHFSGDVSSYNLETDSVLSERLPLYCIPITGDNTSNSISTTSIIEIENLSENQNIILKYQNIDIKPQDHILSFYEKLKLKGVFNSNSSKGFPCIVKLYDSTMNLIKINEVYEIIGVLSYDFHESNTIETPENFESFNSQYPLNLIPRVHCLTLRKLSEAEQENNSIAILSQKLNNKFLNMLDLQKKLMNLLNQVTCGDELTSQYLLFGILNNAQISKKPEFLENIRKLNINIYKTSKVRFLTTSHEEITFSTLLTKLFEKITSKSVYLALSLEDLEKKHYVSKKNYENNRLEIGKLQMTENTMICIDETHMSAGKLTEVGLRNLNFLNDFIENQMLQFDFSYHEIKVPCSCNIIVCSEGKTFLKANINVPLENNKQLIELEPEISEFIADNSTKETEFTQDALKYYLIRSRDNLRKMIITEEVSKKIEEDYVQSRKDSPNTTDIESLERWIILGKLISASQDLTIMPYEHYLQAKQLEKNRLQKLIK